jgi:RHS repeat-associated protein
MNMLRTLSIATVLAVVASSSSRAEATPEICGNDIDDNNNGLTDEGCYPTLTTGVCESPLSCTDTGMVSWLTGSLHYDMPPDIAPLVPYGPGIGFRRFYTPAYSPGGAGPSSVNHTPLGPGWQHTYMTWIDTYSVGGTQRVVLHTNQGRDVFYTDAGLCGTFECYTPQAGDHVLSLSKDPSGFYYVQLLTGETLKYNTVGQLIELWDTMAPTPNKVLITWDSPTNGNVSTVTDASGQRRLLFTYTNNLLTSIQFQILESSWNTQHTTTFDYSNGVTRDLMSGWFVPASAAEWTNLLTGSGIPNPTNLYKCQEASGNLADSIGSTSLTAHNNGGMLYQQFVPGWSRKAVSINSGNFSYWQSSSSICNPASAQCTALGIIDFVNGTTGAEVMSTGDINGARAQIIGSQLKELWDNVNSAVGGTLDFAAHPWIVATDPTQAYTTLQTDQISLTPIWQNGLSANGMFSLGAPFNVGSSSAFYLYAAEWNGTALSSTQRSTLINKIKNGPGILTTVTIGGQLAQTNSYTNGLLTKIVDGGGTQIVAFAYSSTGQLNLVSTSRGTLGFEYASSRTGCVGNTILYFNKGNTTSCNVDTDCGTGFLCGGKTGTGSTGTCFLAGRCMTTSTVNGESVVTNVAPLGPGGGSCSGACADVMAYVWTAAGSGNINVIGREDPLGNFTSATYNTNGLPMQVGYGDTDTDPTTGTNRTQYTIYDTLYPGRVAEIRRLSDLGTGACTATDPTACSRNLFYYGHTPTGATCSPDASINNQLCTIREVGFTLTATGSVTSYTNDINYRYDSVGRVAEIDGAVAGVKSTYDYYTSNEELSFVRNFVKDANVYTDSTNFLQPNITNYDLFGHPTALKDPNGKFTCDTYDSARGSLSSRRRAMAGQTDCTTVNSLDITTSWARDSWQRLTQLTRPDGSCVLYSYDSVGHPYQVKRRDDCNVNSSGDTQQFSYTSDSQVSEVDTYDSTGALTARQPYTYFASRRLQEIINPVNLSTFTGMVYDAAGKLTEVDGDSGLSKKVNHYDNAPGRDGRVTSIDHYKTSSTFDTWSLLYAWIGLQSQVTDGDSKVTGSTRDDLGRLVKITSPDLGGPTLQVFDAANRLTTLIEDLGGASQVTHSFTYDSLDRQTVADYAGRCAPNGGTNHPWIQRVFDGPPGGTCPAGMSYSCTANAKGHLVYVETVLLCTTDTHYPDGSIDQFTWFAYDDAGRLIEEYITDDTNRTANNIYSYTADGTLSSASTPSGFFVAWNYDSFPNNSDRDLVTSIRNGAQQNLIDTAIWFPFGPWQQYNWEATIGGTGLRNRVTRNPAYRIHTVYGAELQTGASANAQVAITEDQLGRVISRVFSPAVTGLTNSYFTYDEQSRVTCESAASGSCPTSGSNLKNNHDQTPPFMNAGDWKEVLRPIAGSSNGTVNNFNTSGTTYGTSHQVTDVNQSNGNPKFGHTAFVYNAYGNRVSDDNTTKLTNDTRTYTYDSRHNVTNVRGQYKTGGAWHFYDVASAFDDKNRRVFKSFLDETTAKTAQWFFYYDALDRLTEVRYTPDISSSGTYSLFDLIWLGDKLVLYWETDYPSATTSKRYVTSDEIDRPMQLWNWPASGDATRVWAVNPSAWGFDTNILGPSVYQPLMFAGQYQDAEATAYENDGVTVHRPGVVVNGLRTYDPFAGAYLQIDPRVDQTFSSYLYVKSDPVGKVDPSGLLECAPGDCQVNTDPGPAGEDPGYCSWACAVACAPFGEAPFCDCNACKSKTADYCKTVCYKVAAAIDSCDFAKTAGCTCTQCQNQNTDTGNNGYTPLYVNGDTWRQLCEFLVGTGNFIVIASGIAYSCRGITGSGPNGCGKTSCSTTRTVCRIVGGSIVGAGGGLLTGLTVCNLDVLMSGGVGHSPPGGCSVIDGEWHCTQEQ